MKLYIKNMVSLRCKMLVKDELKKLGLHFITVDLGVVEIREDISQKQQEQLNKNLLRSGLNLVKAQTDILIEKINALVVEMIHYSDDKPITNYSYYLSKKLGYDYNYLSQRV